MFLTWKSEGGLCYDFNAIGGRIVELFFSKGSVTLVSSIGGLVPFALLGAYSVSKTALLGKSAMIIYFDMLISFTEVHLHS